MYLDREEREVNEGQLKWWRAQESALRVAEEPGYKKGLAMGQAEALAWKLAEVQVR